MVERFVRTSVLRLLCLIFAVIPSSESEASSVDGVLSYDGNATRPIYLRAWELAPTEKIASVRVFNNDRLSPPLKLWLIPAGKDGWPNWGSALGIDPGTVQASGVWMETGFPSAAKLTGKVWVGVEYAIGNPQVTTGEGGGPGLGYSRGSTELAAEQLVSTDGGVTYDRLAPELRLAVELDTAFGAAAGKAPAGVGAPTVETELLTTGNLRVLPNPSNPRSAVVYDLGRVAHVSVVVYDLRGRKIRTLVDHVQSPGTHRAAWNGVDNQGVSVASGVYTVVMVVDGREFRSRITVLK